MENVIKFKEEETEIPTYFFDSSFKTDLKSNYRETHYAPKYAHEKLDEPMEKSDEDSSNYFDLESWIEQYIHEERDNELAEKCNENPAIYSAQAAVTKENAESKLHQSSDEYPQQRIVQQTVKSNSYICTENQTKIGRTEDIKPNNGTEESLPNVPALHQDSLKERIEKWKSRVQKLLAPDTPPIDIEDRNGQSKEITTSELTDVCWKDAKCNFDADVLPK